MSAILKEVKELGRMPNRFKTPQNKEERAENQLSKKIARIVSSFVAIILKNFLLIRLCC